MNMRNIKAVIGGVGLMLFGVVANIQAAQYDHEIQDKKISFAWKVDGDNLAVKVSAQTDGWIGIGFNPTKLMKDANFILGYVKGGKAEVFDEFGSEDNNHMPDDKSGGTKDVTLVGGTEAGGKTTIEFTMPLKPADKHDTAITVDGDTTVLLAYGAGRDSLKSKHQYRTALKVNLSTGKFQKIN